MSSGEQDADDVMVFFGLLFSPILLLIWHFQGDSYARKRRRNKDHPE